ncbi:MAG TPA: AAA family ATPase [Pseudonocardiaceae bacterium]|nr:AAA family ATPase [Pseudonocardiaceae bacterium]
MVGVTIRLAGSFGVVRGATEEVGAGLGSRKARRLLMLLAVDGDRTVPVDRIIDVLWADHPPQRPADNVATLVSRLRAALGPDVIAGNRDGYRLGVPPAVQVDLRAAAQLVTEAERRLAVDEPALAGVAAGRALTLLGTGVVLVDEPDADWAAAARADGDRLVRIARQVAAAATLRTGEPRVAIDAARAAVAADRWDETAHRLLMAGHLAAGEPAKALAVYETLRADLAAELGVDPARETHELYLALLRGQTPPAQEHRRIPAVAPRTDLVGRDGELASLGRAWSAAVSGQPAVVLVAGVAGIGKTSLAEDAASSAAATGGIVLRARCYAAERSLFLQPVVDAMAATLTSMPAGALRELAGARPGDLVGLLPKLAPILGPPSAERGSADIELRRAFEAVAQVLRTLSATCPVLMLLDDLHNAGAATVDLLHYLARHLTGCRVLVLATVRTEEGEAAIDALADVAARLHVGPLDADAVTTLAAADGRADLADTILRRTSGHTLFVVETLRGLKAGQTTVPETLQTAVLAQVRRAGPDTEELLRAGAVLGATVDPAVVGAMLDLPAHVAVQRCERAVSARLLVVAGRSYEFANDLVQEVLYATSPEPLRVAHHRRAADLLTGAPESVGAHAAAVADWPRASRAFLIAGELAMGRQAVADADALLSRALDYAERAGASELVARAYLARGQAREALGDFRRAAGDHHAALGTARSAGDQRTEMLVLRALGGHASLAIGVTVAECSARLHDGLRIAEVLGDREVEADVLGWLAVMATNRLRFTDGLALARRAVRAGRAAGSERALAAGLDGLKNAYAYIGELALLDEVLAELDPLLRRIGNLELLQWTVFESAFSAIAGADWELAVRRAEEALAVNHRSGHPVHESWFVSHLGWLARAQGQFDLAVEHGRHAVELAASLSHRWFLPDADSQLASTLLAAGDRAEAVRLLTRARERAGRNGAEAHVLRCVGPLAEATGSPEVLAEADALLHGISTPAGFAWFSGSDSYLSVARAWLAHGEPVRARAAVAPMLTAAKRGGWLPMEAQASLVDGDAVAALGDRAAAEELFRRAAFLGASYGMPGVEQEALARL